MAQTDALKKYLDAGMAFTNLTRSKAEQVVKDLVAAGELQRGQAKEAIDELLDRSRKNAESLAEQVRKEVDSQLASLGLARKADLEKLQAELADLKGGAPKPDAGKGDAGEPAMATKKAPAKKASPPKAEAKDEGGAKPAEGTDTSTPVKKATKAPAKKASPEKAQGPKAAESTSKATPAKKAASTSPTKSAKKAAAKSSVPAGTSMPAKKTTKKQG